MFGLIPMVITIILATIVGGAFAYFGGDIYSDSSISGVANGYVAEAGQVRSASQLYRVSEAAWPSAVSDLTSATPSLLGSTPSKTFSIASTDGEVTATTTDNADLTQAVCEKIQDAATGSTTILADATAADSSGQLFGCYGASSPYTMFHK